MRSESGRTVAEIFYLKNAMLHDRLKSNRFLTPAAACDLAIVRIR
jgi:hypothetical protein